MADKWHLRLQAGLVAAGTTGLGFLQTAAGGLDPQADPRVNWVISHAGWPLLIIGYGGAIALLAYDLWQRRRPTLAAQTAPGPHWIGIKGAVEHIKNSGWKYRSDGKAWALDMDSDLRAALAKFNGPKSRGREYASYVDTARHQPPESKRIPRSFWRDARIDPETLITTPSRVVARNERTGTKFEDIEVDLAAIKRAFPPRQLPSPPPLDKRPLTLRDCFDKDFDRCLGTAFEMAIGIGSERAPFTARANYDFDAHSSFVSIYIPMLTDNTAAVCEAIAGQLGNLVREMDEKSPFESTQAPGDHAPVARGDFVFSGAVFIYHERGMGLQEMASVERAFAAVGARVTLRSAGYVGAKAAIERAKA